MNLADAAPAIAEPDNVVDPPAAGCVAIDAAPEAAAAAAPGDNGQAVVGAAEAPATVPRPGKRQKKTHHGV